MTTLKEIKNTLLKHKKEISKKFKVKSLEIFGSYVKKEEKKESDIDLLVDFEENADLLDLTGLSLFLEEKLGQKIDVVPKNGLRKELRENILQEAIAI